MRWITDYSGFFRRRPYYRKDELDDLCESRIAAFLQRKYDRLFYPIDTNDLTILLEQETDDLDLYADLSAEGLNVEGVTLFYPRIKPRVRIAHALSASPQREHRLRTTLAHELGHVVLHSFAGQPKAAVRSAQHSTDSSTTAPARYASHRAGRIGWMEWQAAYASGAFLMPRIALRRVVTNAFVAANHREPIYSDSQIGYALIRLVQRQFNVSFIAAQVRLLQLGYLAEPLIADDTAAPHP